MIYGNRNNRRGSFFVKILLHLYIEMVSYEKPSTHIPGYYNNYIYVLPIWDRVPPQYKVLKLVANILYTISIVTILIFLIRVNTGKINDEYKS